MDRSGRREAGNRSIRRNLQGNLKIANPVAGSIASPLWATSTVSEPLIPRSASGSPLTLAWVLEGAGRTTLADEAMQKKIVALSSSDIAYLSLFGLDNLSNGYVRQHRKSVRSRNRLPPPGCSPLPFGG